jgi:two-component system aerobic respiration control sensor histidine kinase ArcB
MGDYSQVIQQIVSKTNHYLELLTIDEQELVSVSALIPGYACWKDNKGYYQGCNEKFAELLGFSSVGQIIGLTDEQLPWKAHHKLLKRVDAEILATGIARALEEGMALPDQFTIDFFTKRIPIHNKTKEVSGILIVLFDITAQKATLKNRLHDHNKIFYELQEQVKALESENFLLKQVIDNLPGSVYWKDKNGKYLGNNNSAKEDMKTIGHEVADPTGKTDHELFSKEIADEFRQNDLKVLNMAKEIVSEEHCILSNGKILTRLSSKKPLYDSTGEIVGIVGNTVDITHLKEVQELRKAKMLAEAANQTKTEFIRNMSHDMRTPLAGSIGGSQLIINKTQDPEIKAVAGQIKTSIEHLLNLMNEIIDVSKLESGSKIDVQNKFSIQQIFENLGNTFMPAFQDRGLDFQMQYDPKLPRFIIGDNSIIQRILLNLLGNAVKFTEKGSIGLVAKLAKIADKEITIELSVSDTGMGIPANKLDQIFDAFKRLTPAYSNRYKGSGLGLFYVKQYVEKLGGEIYVTSEEGKSSTFTCVIPFKRALVEDDLQGAITVENYENEEIELAKLSAHSDQKNVSASNDEKPVQSVNEKLHALLVEDTPLQRTIAQSLLIKQGYEVITAETVKEALEKTSLYTFDLIYMDVGLPDGTGIDITRAIRENASSPNINTTIVALTAHADDVVAKECLAAGMQHVFDKPLNEEKMEVAETVMNNHLTGKDMQMAAPLVETLESLPVIDMEAAIQFCSGSEDMAKEILAMLMNDLPTTFQGIEEAFNKQDWELLKQRVHKLHGALCYCGLPRFKLAARTLEHQIKDSAGSYELAYQKFVEEMNLVMKTFQEKQG